MLTRNMRLTDPADFRKVMRKGRAQRRSKVVIHTLMTDATTPSRFGVIAPNKVFGSAVKRNRAKRQVRAWLQAQAAQHPTGRLVVVRVVQDGDISL